MAQSIVTAQKYFPQIDKSIQPEASRHFQNCYAALNDHDQAITTLSSQFNSLTSKLNFEVSGSEVKQSSTSTSTSTGAGVTAAQASSIANAAVVANFPTQLLGNQGNVNNQTASYTVQSADYAGLVTFNSASATTATLNPSLNARFYTAFENLGTGTVTLQPGTGVGGTGTINGLTNIPLATGQGALVYYDGTNWWAVPIGAAAAGGGVTSLDGLTGAVTLVAGTGITITDNTPSPGDITIAASGGGSGVTSLQTETGAITLTSSGATVVITTPTSSTINLESTGGGLPVNNPTFTGVLTGPTANINHLENTGTSPTVTLHGPAGSGATFSITGNDTAGQIVLVAGSGATTGFIATITLASAFPTSTTPMVQGFDTATNVLFNFASFPAGGGSWQLNAGTAMTSGHTYNIQYICFGS